MSKDSAMELPSWVKEAVEREEKHEREKFVLETENASLRHELRRHAGG